MHQFLGDRHGFIFDLALVDSSVDCCLGVWHQKLKNMGSDLGGAVKGFKDGMKDGGASAEDKSAVPSQVANAAPVAEKPRLTWKPSRNPDVSHWFSTRFA